MRDAVMWTSAAAAAAAVAASATSGAGGRRTFFPSLDAKSTVQVRRQRALLRSSRSDPLPNVVYQTHDGQHGSVLVRDIRQSKQARK
jgi:hypothetical protein